MTRSRSDTLSLTLPSRTRSRARRRKRKRPPLGFWWWLALTIWGIYEAGHLLARGDIGFAALNAATAAIDWKIAASIPSLGVQFAPHGKQARAAE